MSSSSEPRDEDEKTIARLGAKKEVYREKIQNFQERIHVIEREIELIRGKSAKKRPVVIHAPASSSTTTKRLKVDDHGAQHAAEEDDGENAPDQLHEARPLSSLPQYAQPVAADGDAVPVPRKRARRRCAHEDCKEKSFYYCVT